MISQISSEARATAEHHYRKLCDEAGSTNPRKLFDEAINQLPFEVRFIDEASVTPDGFKATGHAWTDYASRTHWIGLAPGLGAQARIHSMAHEIYHLLHHTPRPDNLERIVEYYSKLIPDVPREIIRLLVTQHASAPHLRSDMATMWEQEAEWFAVLVCAQSISGKLKSSKSTLLNALGGHYIAR